MIQVTYCLNRSHIDYIAVCLLYVVEAAHALIKALYTTTFGCPLTRLTNQAKCQPRITNSQHTKYIPTPLIQAKGANAWRLETRVFLLHSVCKMIQNAC